MNNSTVYLFCETEPVIESSNNLTFAPYNVSYPQQDQHLAACELSPEENKWDMIFDFTDTNETGKKTVHHQLLDPSQFEQLEKPVEGFSDVCVNPFPIPKRYGGSAADNDLNAARPEGETFDIRTTSKEDAQKIYEEHQKKQDELEQQKLGQSKFPSKSFAQIYFYFILKFYR